MEAVAAMSVTSVDGTGVTMIVRNVNDPIVKETTYRAHGGAVARMMITSRYLESMDFFAWAALPSGQVIEEHIDPYEEIYFLLSGKGLMKVGDEEREVKAWDAIWIPAGEPHRLINNGSGQIYFVCVAAYPRPAKAVPR